MGTRNFQKFEGEFLEGWNRALREREVSPSSSPQARRTFQAVYDALTEGGAHGPFGTYGTDLAVQAIEIALRTEARMALFQAAEGFKPATAKKLRALAEKIK